MSATDKELHSTLAAFLDGSNRLALTVAGAAVQAHATGGCAPGIMNLQFVYDVPDQEIGKSTTPPSTAHLAAFADLLLSQLLLLFAQCGQGSLPFAKLFAKLFAHLRPRPLLSNFRSSPPGRQVWSILERHLAGGGWRVPASTRSAPTLSARAPLSRSHPHCALPCLPPVSASLCARPARRPASPPPAATPGSIPEGARL